MSTIQILGFLFDDENEEEFTAHGLRTGQLLQVLENPHIIKPNRKRRRGTHLIIGRDHGGMYITIPVEPTHDRSIWRPITAWPSKEHEAAQLD